ncbi:hypothetical protein [Plantactinospora sp. CA-290183]|uniref:hypothetical protein n=1 Tax=Plantactinospora sp. CA-290183 TaxID=3240006 RepID=UPI003D948C61
MIQPQPAPAVVVIGLRRVVDLRQDDVIRLPTRLYLPVHLTAARHGQRARWAWQHRSVADVAGADWRMVYDLDDLDGEDDAILNLLPSCFRPLRVAADEIDQGGTFRSVVLALHEFDLVEVQLAGTDPSQTGGWIRDALHRAWRVAR